MPYEEAQARVQLAMACRELDDDGRDIELDAARQLFAQLGAAPAWRTSPNALRPGPRVRPAGSASAKPRFFG